MFSLAICIAFFALATCQGEVSPLLAVSVAGFSALQLVVFLHKLVLLGASVRGTLSDPNHRCIRELLLVGGLAYCVEIVWAAFCTVVVLLDDTVSMLDCQAFRRPFYAFVVLVWLNWLELAAIALLYFSCLDRCNFFCCKAVCWVKRRSRPGQYSSSSEETDFAAGIDVVPSSHSISTAFLSSLCREHCCTCRRDGLNNSKSIAIRDLSDGLNILFRDIVEHYTALDRLSGWMLIQKYHEQLLSKGKEELVTRELHEVSVCNRTGPDGVLSYVWRLLQATLHFLRKKRVMGREEVVKDPTPLEEGSTVS